MSKKSIPDLSRRERQIMDVIFKKRVATVAEVREAMPDPPSYSSVRALLRILEDKGLLRREIREEKFSRSFILDGKIDRDKIKAKIDNGILSITLPKKEDEVGRKISID